MRKSFPRIPVIFLSLSAPQHTHQYETFTTVVNIITRVSSQCNCVINVAESEERKEGERKERKVKEAALTQPLPLSLYLSLFLFKGWGWLVETALLHIAMRPLWLTVVVVASFLFLAHARAGKAARPSVFLSFFLFPSLCVICGDKRRLFICALSLFPTKKKNSRKR
jgi:hypothetical protein